MDPEQTTEIKPENISPLDVSSIREDQGYYLKDIRETSKVVDYLDSMNEIDTMISIRNGRYKLGGAGAILGGILGSLSMEPFIVIYGSFLWRYYRA